MVRNGAGITLGPGSQNVIAETASPEAATASGSRRATATWSPTTSSVTPARRASASGSPTPSSAAAHNIVRGNLVKGSRVDGFLVNAKDDHSLLSRNTARGAGDDGFDVESRSAKLTENRALRNGDLGIEAVHGVNDGGGNRRQRQRRSAPVHAHRL